MTARHAEIAQTLRAHIEDGTYPVGTQLPTEAALCERHKASRFTIRQAIAALRDAGLVEPKPGVGTTVKHARPPQVVTHRMQSFEELLRYPGETERHQIAITEITLQGTAATELGVPDSSPWTHLQAIRAMRANGAPIAWLDAYIRPAFADVLHRDNPDGASLLSQIETHHTHPATRAQVEVFVGRIDDAIAPPMHCDPGAPALIILRRYTDAAGEIYLVTSSIHPENCFALNFDFAKQNI